MKRLFLLLVLLVVLGGAVWAQLPHRVVLKSGTVLRGKLMETDNDNCLKIKTLDGMLHSYGLDEVEEVGRLSWKDRKRFSCDRHWGVFFRPEIGIGIDASVSLAMGLQIGPYYAVYWGVMGGFNDDDSYSKNIMIGNRFYFSKGRRCMFMDFRMGMGQTIGKNYNIEYYDDNHYEYINNSKQVCTNTIIGVGIGITFGSMDACLSINSGEVLVVLAYNIRRNL